MPCSTAMAWSSVPARDGAARRRELSLSQARPAQRSVGRRLQGRVQARQRPLLLPPDGDGTRPARYVLACEALKSTKEEPGHRSLRPPVQGTGPARPPSEAPTASPFASPNGLYNLSRLSVWWLRLGIAIERIQPGHPRQNGVTSLDVV